MNAALGSIWKEISFYTVQTCMSIFMINQRSFLLGKKFKLALRAKLFLLKLQV